jgi:hypothetical protein
VGADLGAEHHPRGSGWRCAPVAHQRLVHVAARAVGAPRQACHPARAPLRPAVLPQRTQQRPLRTARAPRTAQPSPAAEASWGRRLGDPPS